MHVDTFAEVFLEQPEPVVMAPVGTQIELTCRVSMGYRTVWGVQLPGGTSVVAVETPALIANLLSRGIVTELSTAENRNTPLIIGGTVEINQTTVQCLAVNLSDEFMRCDGKEATVTFYGQYG